MQPSQHTAALCVSATICSVRRHLVACRHGNYIQRTATMYRGAQERRNSRRIRWHGRGAMPARGLRMAGIGR